MILADLFNGRESFFLLSCNLSLHEEQTMFEKNKQKKSLKNNVSLLPLAFLTFRRGISLPC